MDYLNLNAFEWLQLGLCGVLLGMAKTGLSGAGLMIVPIMAGIFGGRESVGIVLPMLLIADIFAVKYYNRHANWKYIVRLVPWAFVGILAGLFFGNNVNDEQFKIAIAVLVLIGIILMLWLDYKWKTLLIPDHWIVTAILGIAGGFTSMIGNAAGPIFTLYFLAMRLPKNIFIGTGAWFYLLLNIMKVPFHVFSWKTITSQSITYSGVTIPALLLGTFLGIKIVKLIPEKAYRIFIVISTIVASLFLL